MADFQANQGSAGHSTSVPQGAGSPHTGNAGGQQGESKTPGLSAEPVDTEASTPPWSPSPSTRGGQAQTPQGCTRVVALALGVLSLLAALSAIVPHIRQ